ncbi:oligoribonuclease [Vibrio pomeroyi]|uniref:Oligoribonuclease n=1 Tax=Vibrio pomeroyi TaxID=198832 RepID=A0ABV4MQR1_9VIBR|nr:oligoribonuclease [Vibrio atlanticus]MCZ4310984.1 oligoribonuclease [Vibrio atlanticus]
MNNVQNDAILFSWADIETGGLDGKREDDDTLGMETYPILEIAMHITDSDLNILDGEGFRVVIHHPDSVLDQMSSWSIKQHTETGLLDEVRQSNITSEQAEQLALEHLKKHNAQPYDREKRAGTIMAGNSIKLDRNYMSCQLPELDQYFHYRQADVSAVALFVREWRPDVEACVNKKYLHLALPDIRESIMEAKVYKEKLFQPGFKVDDDVDLYGTVQFFATDFTSAMAKFDFDDPKYQNDPAIQLLRQQLINLESRSIDLAQKVSLV